MPTTVSETPRKAASNADTTEQLTWTGSYFVWSALSGYTGSTSYGLNVQNATPAAGTPIVLYPWNGGQANELWQYTDNQFVSNLSSSLVIGLGEPVSWSQGNYFLVLVEQNSSDPTQIWDVDATTGLITNAQYPDLYMNVNGGALSSNAQIVTYSLQEGNPDEIWTLMPAWPQATQSAPAWTFIQSGLSPYENEQITPYVLAIEGPNPAVGNNVVLEALSSSNAGSQLWQLTNDRRFLSPLGNDTVLTLGPSCINGIWQVTAGAQQNPTYNIQHWDLGGEAPNQIDNWHVSQFLVVAGGYSGPVSPYGSPQVVVAPGTPNPSYNWYFMPSSPLDAILAQGPVPFPAFEGEQLTAYQYINQQLGLGEGDTPDFRGQYLNVGAQLGQWMNTIQGYTPPNGVSETNWTAVVDQLGSEVTDVLAVQAVFTNYTTWHNAQFADDGTILNGLIADAQMESGTDTSGVGLALAQGALYTALEAIPVVGNVLGNVVNTAINAGLAAHSVSATPFQVAVSQLWTQLSETFLAILGQTALMETAILSDWGKLQAVYPLTLLASGAPGSLSATALGDANLLAASTVGYKISAMQILLPAQYQIYVYTDDDDDPVDDIPSYAQRVENSGNNVWTKYWIASSTNWDLAPGQQALQNDLWDNGVSQWDFFHGADGWGFAVCYVYNTIVDGCNALVATITNQTPNLLTVQVSVPGDQGNISGASSGTLNPYESISFGGQMNGEVSPMTMTLDIYDPNVSTQNWVASFMASQPLSGFEGGTPTVDNQQSNNGYTFSSPICNQAALQGGFKDGYPGAVQIGIYLG